MSEHEFETLTAFDEVPDTKYGYVACRFYNKELNLRLFVRSDIKIYTHQVFNCEHPAIKGLVSTKEIQRHPVNERIIHMDFYVIPTNVETIDVMLPLRFENREKSSVLKLGGFLNITARQVRVKVQRGCLVPHISVDISEFKAEESISLRHINFPEGITPVAKKLTVATLMPSKGTES